MKKGDKVVLSRNYQKYEDGFLAGNIPKGALGTITEVDCHEVLGTTRIFVKFDNFGTCGIDKSLLMLLK